MNDPYSAAAGLASLVISAALGFGVAAMTHLEQSEESSVDVTRHASLEASRRARATADACVGMLDQIEDDARLRVQVREHAAEREARVAQAASRTRPGLRALRWRATPRALAAPVIEPGPTACAAEGEGRTSERSERPFDSDAPASCVKPDPMPTLRQTPPTREEPPDREEPLREDEIPLGPEALSPAARFGVIWPVAAPASPLSAPTQQD